jgi:hypothetical protein
MRALLKRLRHAGRGTPDGIKWLTLGSRRRAPMTGARAALPEGIVTAQGLLRPSQTPDRLNVASFEAPSRTAESDRADECDGATIMLARRTRWLRVWGLPRQVRGLDCRLNQTPALATQYCSHLSPRKFPVQGRFRGSWTDVAGVVPRRSSFASNS